MRAWAGRVAAVAWSGPPPLLCARSARPTSQPQRRALPHRAPSRTATPLHTQQPRRGAMNDDDDDCPRLHIAPGAGQPSPAGPAPKSREARCGVSGWLPLPRSPSSGMVDGGCSGLSSQGGGARRLNT